MSKITPTMAISPPPSRPLCVSKRNESRAECEALSPEEKALVDAKFYKVFVEIAAQFGRSRPFNLEGSMSAKSKKNLRQNVFRVLDTEMSN